MNIKRQCALIMAVDKNIRFKERENKSKDKIRDKMYTILKKVNKCLDEVTKEDLTNSQYKSIIEFLIVCNGYNKNEVLKYYQNLK